jgi:hypothetical protein
LLLCLGIHDIPDLTLRCSAAGPSSLEVASRCGVNSKTIRDIWNRETWVRATRALWTEEEEEAYREALNSKGELLPAAGDAPRGDDHGESQVAPRSPAWSCSLACWCCHAFGR